MAISAAMLMAAGMKPVKAAVVSLLANTAPVAFGAMAAPIIALNGVTGLPLHVCRPWPAARRRSSPCSCR